MTEIQQESSGTRSVTRTQVLPETTWLSKPLESGIPPEGKVVVTITRQFGSGGSEIARLVAQQSGLRIVDDQILPELARRLGVTIQDARRWDEQTTGMAGHLLDAMKFSNPLNVQYNTIHQRPAIPTQTQDQIYLQLTQRIILENASQGNVIIVGRGSQFLLYDTPRTLHISVFAPLSHRIEHITATQNITRTAANQLIEQRDYEQNNYLRRYYGTDGHQQSFYHILINTGLFSYEQAARIILQTLPIIQV